MPRYRVRFLKTVSNDTGHEARACQASVDVDAATESKAVERAKDTARRQGALRWAMSGYEVEVVAMGTQRSSVVDRG